MRAGHSRSAPSGGLSRRAKYAMCRKLMPRRFQVVLVVTVALVALILVFAMVEGELDPEPRFTQAQNREFPGLTQDQEGRWDGPYFFIQMADPQLGLFTGNKGFEKETELAELAVRHVNRLKPRFVIVCGDMTQATPGQRRYRTQLKEFRRIFRQVDPTIPLLLLPGNHDVNRPTPESIASYRKYFGDDYYGFWVGGVRALVLNSNLPKDPQTAQEEFRVQDQWFRDQLEAARESGARHIFVFQHHPWFLETPEEEDTYYNIPVVRRSPALEIMKNAGVRAVFAGHYHRTSFGTAGDLEMITTGPIGKPDEGGRSGLRIVKVFGDRIEHEFYGFEEVPPSISLAEEAPK